VVILIKYNFLQKLTIKTPVQVYLQVLSYLQEVRSWNQSRSEKCNDQRC